MRKHEREIKSHRDTLLHGRCLGIDPSSGKTSPVGWALSEHGVVIEDGVIDVPPGDEVTRLQFIAGWLWGNIDDVELLVIEKLRKSRWLNVSPCLMHSVGAIMAACGAPACIELPIQTWRAYATKEHLSDKSAGIPTDARDARAILESAIDIAKGYNGRARSPSRRKDKTGAKTKTRSNAQEEFDKLPNHVVLPSRADTKTRTDRGAASTRN